jgi:hypothetical protein
MWVTVSYTMSDVTSPLRTVLFNPIHILFYFHKLIFSKETTGISLLLRFAHTKLR